MRPGTTPRRPGRSTRTACGKSSAGKSDGEKLANISMGFVTRKTLISSVFLIRFYRYPSRYGLYLKDKPSTSVVPLEYEPEDKPARAGKRYGHQFWFRITVLLLRQNISPLSKSNSKIATSQLTTTQQQQRTASGVRFLSLPHNIS